MPVAEIAARDPIGIVLSRRAGVDLRAGRAGASIPELFELGVPVLGICYGMQAMAAALGGEVGEHRPRRVRQDAVRLAEGSLLFGDIAAEQTCWMSHRDSVVRPPAGFTVTAVDRDHADRRDGGSRARVLRRAVPSRGRAHAARHRDARAVRARGLPGAAHLDARCSSSRSRWSVIREQVGDDQVICALSGGVDSAVAALLVHKRGGRPAHLRVRRPRPAAQGRGRAGGGGVRGALPRPARARAGAGPVSRQAGRRHRPRDEAPHHRRGVHPPVRGRGAEAGRRPTTWCRARSTRT